VFFKAGRADSEFGRLPIRVGYEYIDDGRKVFNLLRDVQKGAA